MSTMDRLDNGYVMSNMDKLKKWLISTMDKLDKWICYEYYG